ncbi:MAG: hypothetical protein KDE51_13690, partial [Anaerolineales bacterium]|nr:hypothetical protein [Anaerolineales bacterium]
TAAPTEEPTPVPTEAPSSMMNPAPEPTTVDLEAGVYVYSNGNFVRDATLFAGKIWAATTGGLVTYDVASGEAYKYTTEDGLPNIGTFTVEVCPVNGEDRLIVGTREGLVLYNAADNSWESGETIGFNDTDSAIHIMTCDAANGRLILEYDDVSILDLASGSLTNYTEDGDGLAWFSFEQLPLVNGDIWATTGYKGASQIAADGTITLYSEGSSNLPDDDVYDVAQTADGALWFGASDGLFQWQNGEFITFDRDNSPAISYFGPDHLEVAADGSLWVAFTSDVCQFDPATGNCSQLFDVADLGLSSEGRISMMQAYPDGTMLVGTYQHGVAYYDGAAWSGFALENQTPANFFNGLYQTSDGTIWTTGEGLYTTDVDASSWDWFESVYPNDIIEDLEGNIWFAESSRITLFDGQRLTQYTAEESDLPDDVFLNIIIADDGRIYAGGYDGYAVIDGDTILSVGEEDGWEFGTVNDLLAADGQVYAATFEGLFLLDGDSYEHIVDDSFVDLPSTNINELALYTDGAIVLGTGAGLAYYQDGALRADPVVTGGVTDMVVLPSGE